MKEEVNYYVYMNGELFIYHDVLEEIEKNQLELIKKLFEKDVSVKEYKEALAKYPKIIDNATKFVNTKREFLEEFLSHNMSLKSAKESWKHEREHFFRAKEYGLTSKIGITHIIFREQSQSAIRPRTRNNLLDFIEGWSLEKIKQFSFKMLNVSDLSDSDEERIKFLKNLLISL